MKQNNKRTLLFLMFVVSAHSLMCAQEKNWFFSPSDDLNKFFNRASGYAAACVGKVSSLFLAHHKNIYENLLFKTSEIKAKSVFWLAYDSVPAYKDFVGMPTQFSAIPLMTQETYLQRYPLEKTLKDGCLPALGFIDPVDGNQGASALRIKGLREAASDQEAINFVQEVFLGDEKYVCINMLMPTNWSLGMQRSLGQNNADAYETLKVLGAKHKYLIAGDMAFIKYFINNSPLSFKNFDITLLVEGGFVSRALRTYFMSKGVKKVLGAYGIADIRPMIGIQDDFSQKLQELCLDNPQFKKDLTGCENGTPYFLHYNPLNDYLEEIDGRLIFTDLDQARISPRIRYDADIQGSLLKMSFVKKVLKHHGISLDAAIDLPLMCLYGTEQGIKFNDAKLSFEHLEIAVLMTSELARKVNRQTYNQIIDADNQTTLELWVELKDGISPARFNVADLESKVHGALCAVNPVFKREFENGAKPRLKIFAYGDSPMPMQK